MFPHNTRVKSIFISFNTWHSLKTGPVKLRAGENILKFKAAVFKRYPNSARDLYVLFDALSFDKE